MPSGAKDPARAGINAPAVSVDLSLEAVGHPRSFAAGVVAPSTRCAGCTAATGGGTFQRPGNMDLANPARAVASRTSCSLRLPPSVPSKRERRKENTQAPSRLDHCVGFELQLGRDLLNTELAARQLHDITIFLHGPAHQCIPPVD
jgi:hypothetical protein